MFNKIKLLLTGSILLASIFTISADLHAYTKKAAYEGYGKISKVTGKPKTKLVSGHVKKTSKGYTYVNPYAKTN